jgi:hypothetical protein
MGNPDIEQGNGNMTTTIELPDSVYRQLQAQTAKLGKTIDAFVLDAIHEKLAEAEPAGWRSVFGKGDKEAVAEVQRIIDEEFSYPQP